MPIRIAEVKWVDSIIQQHGWLPVSEYQVPTQAEREHFSCGYVIRDTAAGMMLALSLGKPETEGELLITDAMWIPRQAILEVRELHGFVKSESWTLEENVER